MTPRGKREWVAWWQVSRVMASKPHFPCDQVGAGSLDSLFGSPVFLLVGWVPDMLIFHFNSSLLLFYIGSSLGWSLEDRECRAQGRERGHYLQAWWARLSDKVSSEQRPAGMLGAGQKALRRRISACGNGQCKGPSWPVVEQSGRLLLVH